MNKDNNIDLSVRLGPMYFTNPVIAASGTFGYGIEFDPFVDLKFYQSGYCGVRYFWLWNRIRSFCGFK